MKSLLLLGVLLLSVNTWAQSQPIPLKADCRVYCTGPICGGQLQLDVETNEQGGQYPLEGSFQGIKFHVSLKGSGRSLDFPEMPSLSVFFTRGEFPDTQVLSSSKVLLDLEQLPPGGRVFIRTDWYNGGEIGNLAGMCLVTKQ